MPASRDGPALRRTRGVSQSLEQTCIQLYVVCITAQHRKLQVSLSIKTFDGI